ncbi:hypothetical protein [Hymenobacter latericus]|uniref:hypothetical protein n=1 Tax=Hymenobacter sp. YIM 151858-1 TaxID=2987688 RepID=UPI002227E53E|nr:hypothetical protein [Hymenobacter sp. YIM 151858-1]UYZ60069.1 hypothetical protein OIS50_04535 [Hymenobacter sp. YIM 151858-1]
MKATKYTAEVQHRISQHVAAGGQVMTPQQFKQHVSALGYDVRQEGRYYNNLNAFASWPAVSCTLVDRATGHNFSNTAASKNNLEQLQEARVNVLVVTARAIWEY